MFISIRFKLIFSLIVVSLIGVSSYIYLSYSVGKRVFLGHLQDDAITISQLVSDSFVKMEEIKASVKIQDLVKLLSLTEGVFEINVYDVNGKIIFDTFPQRVGSAPTYLQVFEVIKNKYYLSGFMTYKDEIGLKFEEKVFKGYYPLIYDGEIAGAVGVALEIYDYLTAPEETRKFILKEMEKSTRLLAEAVAYAVKNAMEIERFLKTEDVILTLVNNSKVLNEINIFDSEKRIILSSRTENLGKAFDNNEISFDNNEIRASLIKKENKDFYEIFIPVKASGKEMLMNIVFDASLSYAVLKRNLSYNIILALICFSFAIFFFYLLGTRIIKPIESLVKATAVVASGNLEHKIQFKSNDELGKLALSFDAMVEHLKVARENTIKSTKLAAIGQLASSIAHELRNPLAVIKNCAYYIKTKVPASDDKVAKHLIMINAEIDASERIISGLLNFSRNADSQKVNLQINDMLDDVLSFSVAPFSVKVIKEFDPSSPVISGDPGQLKQVFINFIINAYEAMPKGGELKVITQHSNDFIEVIFADTGCGIPPENLKKIADPFFTTKIKGTGLGMAISHKIIEAHKAKLEVISEVDKGTRFTIKFPVAEV